MKKNSRQAGTRVEWPLIKHILKNPTANFILHDERVTASPKYCKNKVRCPLSQSLFNTVLKFLATTIKQEKEIKDTLIVKKK